jgi:putative transposase
VACAAEVRKPLKGVRIDLGLKDFATLSTGEKIGAQRAGKKKRVKAIHAKVVNRRSDFHHKLSTCLVNNFD